MADNNNELSANVQAVKDGLSITDETFDNYLTLCENIITPKILDNINQEELPERLNSLIQEFLINQYTLNQDGAGKGTTVVSSASDNGQSVSFSNVGMENIKKNADDFLEDNEMSLCAYRKIRW